MGIKITESIAVVICAAGSSKRMGGVKKEYQKIDRISHSPQSLTVLGSAVKAFFGVESVKNICVAIPKNDEENARNVLQPDFLNSSELFFTEGGETRQASVYNALRALAQYNPELVLIHDGARPFVSSALINSVIDAAKKHGAAIPVLPLTDTPKEFEGDYITRHLKRANTGIAQTPQGFKFSEILIAHERAAQGNEEFTDDAEVWGKYCGSVAVVPGDAANRKITFQGDL